MNRGKARAVFRLSPGGTAVLLTSAGLFAAGFVRGELASLLWGGGLFMLCLLSFSGILISAGLNRRISRNETGGDFLLFQDQSCFPGSVLQEDVRFPPGIRQIPGILLEFRWEAAFNSRILSLIIPVKSRKSSQTASLTPLERGTYLSRAGLVIRDFPGIFRMILPLPGTSRLTVFPVIPEEENKLPLETLGGDQTPRERARERSRELFDIRKYTPGDDPRRVHWKLFARSGELFLRQGEPEPPPSGRYQVVLDLSLPDSAGYSMPAGMRAACFEWFLARTAGLLVSLLARGSMVRLYVPGDPAPGTFSPGEERKLLSSLSGLWFFSGKEAPGAASPSPDEGVYLCSTPFSPGAENLYRGLAGAAASRKYPVRILCPGLPLDKPEVKYRFIYRWFVLPTGDLYSFPGGDGRFYRAWEEGMARMEGITEAHNVRIY